MPVHDQSKRLRSDCTTAYDDEADSEGACCSCWPYCTSITPPTAQSHTFILSIDGTCTPHGLLSPFLPSILCTASPECCNKGQAASCVLRSQNTRGERAQQRCRLAVRLPASPSKAVATGTTLPSNQHRHSQCSAGHCRATTDRNANNERGKGSGRKRTRLRGG